jgi:CoA-transferase family III
MAKVLNGVTVLEMGTFITGPAAGMLLADLGADVIKVEQPVTGDPFRAFEGGLYSPHFQTYNRNKRSVTLDTRQPEDRARFDGLAVEADVFIQNFRPGVAEKLGRIRRWCIVRFPDSAPQARTGIAPPSTPSPRPRADSCAFFSTRRTRGSWVPPSATPSPDFTPRWAFSPR